MDDMGSTLISDAANDSGAVPDGGTLAPTADSSGDTLLASLAADGGSQQGQQNQQQQQRQQQGQQNQQGQQQVAEATVPDSPDGYTLEFVDGVAVDTTMLTGFQAVAHEMGLNTDQAQKLAGFYADQVERIDAERDTALRTAMLDARKQWEGEIKKSPTFELDRVRIGKVLKQYGTPELYDLFNATNIGSHPDFFRFLANVGKELGEPNIVGSGGGVEGVSAAKKLYPGMA